jgi:hypothetical protein
MELALDTMIKVWKTAINVYICQYDSWMGLKNESLIYKQNQRKNSFTYKDKNNTE